MREEAERLLVLWRGRRIEKPPLWEPWFCMGAMLDEYYEGSYLKMAEDLGHAAVPLGSAHIDAHFYDPKMIPETGVYYGGGYLREAAQLHSRPTPRFATQLANLKPQQEAIRRAGRLSWLVLPWSLHVIATSMSLQHLAMAVYDEPEFVHEAMQWVEARNQQAVRELVARLKPDFVLLDGDCAYRSGTMLQPAMMRDFCLEPTRRTVEMVQELEIPVVFHTDGKLDDVIPLLLELDIVGVHGCESMANDLGHLVAEFGDQITLCGNMDVVFLSRATPAEVRQATREMLRIGSARGRFVAGCNTSPLDYIPVENYIAMARAVADYQPL